MDALSQITSQMILIPAYGRTYKTKESLLDAWQNGKDFKIRGGPYCSIRDINSMRLQASTIWLTCGFDFNYVRI